MTSIELQFLIDGLKSPAGRPWLGLKGLRVGAYGAAAKGNTLMNFAGIRPDLVPYVVDRATAKQGKFMPGSRIPIVGRETLDRERPDYLLVLPWNILHEVRQQSTAWVQFVVDAHVEGARDEHHGRGRSPR